MPGDYLGCAISGYGTYLSWTEISTKCRFKYTVRPMDACCVMINCEVKEKVENPPSISS